ncbi:5-formyltetrahydrofolate cyclo-ligase [Eubacterium oxidoreducens]|uniref:5-formyltetrahydrofolate cyclo-ligase n=1 Tax=Eubacterium oxidoreducens TaxID=1732 RepID=A0A1G6AC55_EUBOX|nr:5-formyltetrahydrofolate cyclo-ligase [Eubacterium oxidoreducens]SDB05998.1 5-formyltetrahydrofolate cyclo-ligase [Eubacterium oxidoreducens]
MNKKQQRALYSRLRNEMSDMQRTKGSEKICARLKKLFCEYQVDAYLAFYPLGSEVSLVSFMEELMAEGKELALPKVKGDDMIFYKVCSWEQLEEGCFHVMEPVDSCEEFAFADKKIAVLTPGLVFDTRGYRMGYGKGYYDRFFARHSGLWKIGIGFEEQIASRVETDELDIELDLVVTPNRIIKKSN